MKHITNNLLSKIQWLIVIFFFILLVAFGYYLFFTPISYTIEEPLIFEVRQEETFNQISNRLYQLGIVKNKFVFKVAAFIYGAEKKIKAARYKIYNNLSYLDLLDLLIYGPADYLKKVKIYDGDLLNKIAVRLNHTVKIDTNKFLKLVYDQNFLISLNINAKSLEGYLLPGEYYFYENTDEKEIIISLTKALKNFWDVTVQNNYNNVNFDKHNILTLASIIEGETDYVDEMNLISAVYHNRLRLRMKLQADPTIQYALGGEYRRLKYSDLKINSPYNTYKYYGLPPGPINNPGKDAILAALNPADVDYLFFVADGTGKHKFAKTYRQHLENVKEYRKWLNSRNSN